MAQNDIKKYETELAFHNAVRSPLERWSKTDVSLENVADFLVSADATDYPNSPLVDLAALRTALTAYFASTEYIALKASLQDFIRIV